MSQSILLIAHGSRRAEANADLEKLAELFRPEFPKDHVAIAYLELANPDIPTALQECVDHGSTEIRMLPYFLSAGSHVSDDLRGFRDEFQAKFPAVNFTLCPPLGLHPRLIDALKDRLLETL